MTLTRRFCYRTEMERHNISVIFGTRPEAIKLAPVILALKEQPWCKCALCSTGQHREMLQPVMRLFGFQCDVDLSLMQPDQHLGQFTSRAIAAIDTYLRSAKPDLVLVQGDTTTVFCAAVAAFYRRIPLGHVEAGLRTWNLEAPWPEEAHRVLVSRLARLHFAPTESARINLIREGVPAGQVFVTGNTVIDALRFVQDRLQSGIEPKDFVAQLGVDPSFADHFLDRRNVHTLDRKLILVTGHRRESFGTGLRNLCLAIRTLVDTYQDVGVIYPVHLNPNVQTPVKQILGCHPRIQLIPPVGYEQFIWLMSKAFFIVSDSGGVQEEAPSLGKPVLVTRDVTERPEGVEAGTCRLVGTDPEPILREATVLLRDHEEYQRRSMLRNPYGDGQASARIVEACRAFLSNSVRK